MESYVIVCDKCGKVFKSKATVKVDELEDRAIKAGWQIIKEKRIGGRSWHYCPNCKTEL